MLVVGAHFGVLVDVHRREHFAPWTCQFSGSSPLWHPGVASQSTKKQEKTPAAATTTPKKGLKTTCHHHVSTCFLFEHDPWVHDGDLDPSMSNSTDLEAKRRPRAEDSAHALQPVPPIPHFMN